MDIILSGASFAGAPTSRWPCRYFPFIFRDAEHQLKYAKSDVFKELAKGYDDKSGNHITALTYYGARHVTSSAARPVAKPEDMKGLKIRVPDAPAYLAFPKALGANPTPIAFAEVYLALQNGTVDAQENPLPTIEAKKFYEVQKNISLTGHIVDSLLTIVSGQLWGKLSADEKKIFTEVMQEAAEKTGREIIASEARLVEEFKKKGNNVITVDKNAFREAVLKSTKPTDQGTASRTTTASLRSSKSGCPDDTNRKSSTTKATSMPRTKWSTSPAPSPRAGSRSRSSGCSASRCSTSSSRAT